MTILSDDYGVIIVNSIGNASPWVSSADDVYPTKFAKDIDNLVLAGASDMNCYRAGFSLKSSDEDINSGIIYAPGMGVTLMPPSGTAELGHGSSYGQSSTQI